MEWGPIITGVLSIFALLLKQYMDGAPKRQEEARNALVEKGREDIADGNTIAVNARADELLSGGSLPTEGNPAADSAGGQHSDESEAERFQKLLNS